MSGSACPPSRTAKRHSPRVSNPSVILHTTAAFHQQAGVCRTNYLHPPDDLDTVAGDRALAVLDQEELSVRRRLIRQPFQPGTCPVILATLRRRASGSKTFFQSG